MTGTSQSINRRAFIQSIGMGAAAAGLAGLAVRQGHGAVAGADPSLLPEGKLPNILWLSVEDISPDLGCYGVDYADTPHLDAFAAEGVRFASAHTHAGVCAPVRSGTIMGMYPSSMGTNPMRCAGVPIPEVKCFPQYLREAGYYCTNNSKTDYQFNPPLTAWDESSNTAHWRNRPKDKPFFCVINRTGTHESQIRSKFDKTDHDPEKAVVPPYYPDTPATRRDWARYHDNITRVDKEIRGYLDQLEADGLAEDTIVWFWGDHGRGLPRAKRWLYESGTHVPLLIRVPEKYRQWASPQNPAAWAPGTVNANLVSFVDFAPTLLSLAGIEIPDHLQGHAFMGPRQAGPREYIYGARDRMDEAYDCIRMIRDQKYRYIRNYMPHQSRGQNIDYMNQMPTTQELRRLYEAGKLYYPQTQFLEPVKPVEELYDVENDPHEINNLAWRPEYENVKKRLRRDLTAWMKDIHDVGLIPEPDFDAMKWPDLKTERAAAPQLKVVEGASGKVTVQMTCPTPGASIAWRLDGKAGANKDWKVYTKPIELDPSETLTAKAVRIGFRDSADVRWKPGDPAPQAAGGPATKHWREQVVDSGLSHKLIDFKELDFKGREAIPEYMQALNDPIGPIRYWSVVGLRSHCEGAEEITAATEAVRPLLKDASPSTRMEAAHALCQWGQADEGLPVLMTALSDSPNQAERLFAAIALGRIGDVARPAIPKLRAALDDKWGYVGRASLHALRALGETV